MYEVVIPISRKTLFNVAVRARAKAKFLPISEKKFSTQLAFTSVNPVTLRLHSDALLKCVKADKFKKNSLQLPPQQ